VKPVVDVHCHIYPQKISDKAVASIGNFYDIPMHHNGQAQSLIEVGDRAGVTHFIVHSVATVPNQVRYINEFLAETVAESNGRMIGFGTLHPDSPDVIKDIDHLIELGLRGIKLHPDFQKFLIDEERALKIYEYAEGKLPILFHIGDYRYEYSHPQRLANIMKRFPNLVCIAAHFGGWTMWEEGVKYLAGLPNLYTDCSSSLFAITPEKAKELVEAYGADRVIFGSDYPMWDAQEELQRLATVGLSEEEMDMIRYKNVSKLLNLGL